MTLRILGVMDVDVRDVTSNRHDGEDWLGTESEFAWIDDDPQGRATERTTGSAWRRGRKPEPREEDVELEATGHPDEATFRRRRTIGLVVALAILGGVIVAAVIAFSGSEDTPSSAAQTLPATTAGQPATSQNTPTTPATTTTPETPSTPTTTLTVDLAAGEKLQQGDTGDTVTQLQQGLTALGFEPGTADGDFGPTTEAAVVAFQNANGLAADGVVGTNTVTALNAALAKQSNAG